MKKFRRQRLEIYHYIKNNNCNKYKVIILSYDYYHHKINNYIASKIFHNNIKLIITFYIKICKTSEL